MSTALSVGEVLDQLEDRKLETAELDAKRNVGEPLVYQRKDEHSYFMDRALMVRGDVEAAERLERHSRQMEYRVTPNLEAGHGLEFTVPAWINELFATAPRPGEVIQRLVREAGNEFVMPQGVSSIALPRITTGTEANDQTPNFPTDNQDVVTKEVKAQALVYSGESDWSIQAMEQSPQGAYLDSVIFKDLSASLDANLEIDLVSGRGETLNEALGLLNITGINAITATGAVEAKVAFPKIGEAMAAVGVERKMPPDAWLMTSARLAWLATAADTEQRPMILTDNVGDSWPVASMSGIPVYLDDAITRVGGANKNEEPVFAVRSNDFILWHSPITTAVFEEVLSGSLGVRFLLRRTTASMLHRYPSGISAVTGTAMKAKESWYS